MTACRRPSQLGLHVTAALLFAASAAVTVAWCGSMSAMPGMPMPGGWTMSMAWMRMPGQSWVGAGGSFVGMWAVMMVAMMMPSLVPMLRRYRASLPPARAAPLTWLVALGYHAVWTAIGLGAFPAGAALAALEMGHPCLARAVPFAAGAVVLVAGTMQLTAWKRRVLACCREPPRTSDGAPWTAVAACRHGWQLGVRCSLCCAGLTAILLVAGVMDLRAMAVVAGVTTLERLAPGGHRVARAAGALAIGASLILITRAALAN